MSLFEVNVGRATKGLVGQAAGRRGREGLGRRQLPCVFHPEALCAYLPPGVEFFGGGFKAPRDIKMCELCELGRTPGEGR